MLIESLTLLEEVSDRPTKSAQKIRSQTTQHRQTAVRRNFPRARNFIQASKPMHPSFFFICGACLLLASLLVGRFAFACELAAAVLDIIFTDLVFSGSRP